MKQEDGTAASGAVGPNPMLRTVNELTRLFRKEVRKVCEENGVPLGYRSLLFHLTHRNGCSQKELAECTGLSAATVSITLEKMERDRYITRKKDESDGRAVRVYLTDKGTEIDRKNKEKIEQLEGQFCSYVSSEEQAQVTGILERMIRAYCLDKDLPYPPPHDCEPCRSTKKRAKRGKNEQ